MRKANPRELNPYLKDGGSGYPDDSEGTKTGGSQLLSTAVGDGGASWRLKALRRAQEQAEREGRKLDEVGISVVVLHFYYSHFLTFTFTGGSRTLGIT